MSTGSRPRTSLTVPMLKPVPAYWAAATRSAGSWPYSALPGQAVLLPSRCPEMRWNVTGVPAG